MGEEEDMIVDGEEIVKNERNGRAMNEGEGEGEGGGGAGHCCIATGAAVAQTSACDVNATRPLEKEGA